MIVRITFDFSDEDIPIVMLFGDSYKNWTQQFEEYIGRFRKTVIGISRVETSFSSWIGWGGAKWISHEDFQERLNREGCQANEPDNPSSRQYAQMKFHDSARFLRYAQEQAS